MHHKNKYVPKEPEPVVCHTKNNLKLKAYKSPKYNSTQCIQPQTQPTDQNLAKFSIKRQ